MGERKPLYEDALRGILTRLEISSDVVETIIRHYKEEPEKFEGDAYWLYNYLVAMGLRPRTAQGVVNQFYTILGHTEQLPMVNMMTMATGQVNPMNPMMPAWMWMMPPRRNEDSDLKDLIKYVTIAKALTAPQQASQPFPPFPMMGPMKYEPVIGKDGKPVLDEFGRPVYRYTILPMAMGAGKSGATGEQEDRLMTLLSKLWEMEKQGKIEIEKKFYEQLMKDSSETKEQLKYLLSRDPTEDFTKVLTKLQELGLINLTGGQESPEVAKMKVELEKFKTQQELALKKWLAEKEDERQRWLAEEARKREELARARENVREIGETIRQGIKEVFGPIGQAIAKGYLEGRLKPGFTASATSQGMVESMSPSEIQERLKQVEVVEQAAREAKKELQQQLQAKSQPSPPQPPPTTTSESTTSLELQPPEIESEDALVQYLSKRTLLKPIYSHAGRKA